jgi:diaminohydroxyphosphoribosylaminopyrimidine deaminase/5-amino-6-(5-phosphoribosylamino)uracil reductase
VGIGTALADDPELTVREAPAPRVPPLRVVFDRGARLPLGGRLARTAGGVGVVVVAAPDAPAARLRALDAASVRVVAAADLDAALAALRRDHGVRALLVEGGAGLAGALWAADLVDRLIIFRAPLVLHATVYAVHDAPG